METMMKLFAQNFSRNWLWLAVNTASLLPLIRLVWMVVEVPTARGPVMFASGTPQDIVLFSGKTALILLVLSLVCTPAANILGFHPALKVRKSLGLWGFFYACFHALFFMGGKDLLFEGEAWRTVWLMLPSILSGLTKMPYARYGAYALLLLLPLALTSNRLAMRLLRKNWKRLHRLVYLAVPLAIYHYWQREDFIVFTDEAPDYWQPAIFALGVALLLLMRLPLVRRWLAARLNLERLRQRRSIPQPQAVSVAPEVTVARETAHPFDVLSQTHTNDHGVDVVKRAVEVQQPPLNGALAVVIWLVHITYLGKRQHHKHELKSDE
jgi:sulfoxide reductase heme-binding subunit YedZ